MRYLVHGWAQPICVQQGGSWGMGASNLTSLSSLLSMPAMHPIGRLQMETRGQGDWLRQSQCSPKVVLGCRAGWRGRVYRYGVENNHPETKHPDGLNRPCLLYFIFSRNIVHRPIPTSDCFSKLNSISQKNCIRFSIPVRIRVPGLDAYFLLLHTWNKKVSISASERHAGTKQKPWNLCFEDNEKREPCGLLSVTSKL